MVGLVLHIAGIVGVVCFVIGGQNDIVLGGAGEDIGVETLADFLRVKVDGVADAGVGGAVD